MDIFLEFLVLIIKIPAFCIAIISISIKLDKFKKRKRNQQNSNYSRKPDYQPNLLTTNEKKEIRTYLVSLDSLIDEVDIMFKKVNLSKSDIVLVKKICDYITEEIQEILDSKKLIFLELNLHHNLRIFCELLKRSIETSEKEPVFQVHLKYKLQLPVLPEPLEDYWEREIFASELKRWIFSGDNIAYTLLGIELTYSRRLIEASIESKEFKESFKEFKKFFENTIEEIKILLDQFKGERKEDSDRNIFIKEGNYNEHVARDYFEG